MKVRCIKELKLANAHFFKGQQYECDVMVYSPTGEPSSGEHGTGDGVRRGTYMVHYSNPSYRGLADCRIVFNDRQTCETFNSNPRKGAAKFYCFEDYFEKPQRIVTTMTDNLSLQPTSIKCGSLEEERFIDIHKIPLKASVPLWKMKAIAHLLGMDLDRLVENGVIIKVKEE